MLNLDYIWITCIALDSQIQLAYYLLVLACFSPTFEKCLGCNCPIVPVRYTKSVQQGIKDFLKR